MSQSANRAAELRALFVVRMETENDKYEMPEHWRMNGDYAERGVETGRYIEWFRIHPLSPFLCRCYIEKRDRIEQGIPY